MKRLRIQHRHGGKWGQQQLNKNKNNSELNEKEKYHPSAVGLGLP